MLFQPMSARRVWYYTLLNNREEMVILEIIVFFTMTQFRWTTFLSRLFLFFLTSRRFSFPSIFHIPSIFFLNTSWVYEIEILNLLNLYYPEYVYVKSIGVKNRLPALIPSVALSLS